MALRTTFHHSGTANRTRAAVYRQVDTRGQHVLREAIPINRGPRGFIGFCLIASSAFTENVSLSPVRKGNPYLMIRNIFSDLRVLPRGRKHPSPGYVHGCILPLVKGGLRRLRELARSCRRC